VSGRDFGETVIRAAGASVGNVAAGAHHVSEELAHVLYREAGLGAPVALGRFGVASNTHLRVTAATGEHHVLRHYRESESRAAVTRMRRERWTLELLGGRGVPVPEVLASSEAEAALLLRFVVGEELGTVLVRLEPTEAADAWRSSGAVLAACHRIDAATAAEAGCERVGIDRPDTSRGPWHRDQARANLADLAAARPDVAALADFVGLVERAAPLYERAPLALCQCDAHLWQFLIADGVEGWRCTALLDWEDADLDDPDWDLAGLDCFRWTTVGAVPDAFFAGYGRRPCSPLYHLYRLERAAWILTAWARGERWVELSVPPAERFVRELAARSDALRATIDRAVQAGRRT
jgi:aminoglycoside phosphotransferase (APT) family kinase protein